MAVPGIERHDDRERAVRLRRSVSVVPGTLEQACAGQGPAPPPNTSVCQRKTDKNKTNDTNNPDAACSLTGLAQSAMGLEEKFQGRCTALRQTQ